MKMKHAANYIDENKEHLVNLWEDRAISEISSAQDSGKDLLRGHLAELLDDLVKSLNLASWSKDPRKASEENFIKSRSQQHVESRLQNNDSYHVDEVLEEYIIFRQVITDQLVEANLCEIDCVEAVNRMFELASLEAVKKFMAELQVCKQRVLSTLVHDIRSPLSVAISAHEVLGDFLAPGDLGEQMYSMVGRSLDRSLEMITTSLNYFSEDTRTKLVLDFKRINLSKTYKEVLSDLEQVYGSRIKIKKIDDNIEGVFAEQILIRILENLISNALKFGDPERPVTISLINDESEACLLVHNWGNPIPKKNQERIYEMFQTNLGSKKISSKGWGLGLTHVQITAKAHGGFVNLISTEELGTEFKLVLRKSYQEVGEKEFRF
jgi:hypothetical protein